jgi:hypothetical protein
VKLVDIDKANLICIDTFLDGHNICYESQKVNDYKLNNSVHDFEQVTIVPTFANMDILLDW